VASKRVIEEIRPVELTLDEGMAFLGEDDLFDMVNLTSEDTGVDAIISTNVPRLPRGPRVKYFQKTGKGAAELLHFCRYQPRGSREQLARPRRECGRSRRDRVGPVEQVRPAAPLERRI
jgi:hypothetical protein